MGTDFTQKKECNGFKMTMMDSNFLEKKKSAYPKSFETSSYFHFLSPVQTCTSKWLKMLQFWRAARCGFVKDCFIKNSVRN